MIAVAPGVPASAELRAQLADLYGAYDEALGEGQYERWPEFFTEACVYKITSRENYDAKVTTAKAFILLAQGALMLVAGCNL